VDKTKNFLLGLKMNYHHHNQTQFEEQPTSGKILLWAATAVGGGFVFLRVFAYALKYFAG